MELARAGVEWGVGVTDWGRRGDGRGVIVGMEGESCVGVDCWMKCWSWSSAGSWGCVGCGVACCGV